MRVENGATYRSLLAGMESSQIMNTPRVQDPQHILSLMKRVVASLMVALAVFGATGCGEAEPQWIYLFDGSNADAWTDIDGNPLNDKWQVVGDSLMLTEVGGGDILTRQTFENFELSIEWKISPQGNSGIFYRVAKDGSMVWKSGPEYQILDDTSFPDLESKQRSAAVFDMYSPNNSEVRPVGEFNQALIRLDRGHVEHWLNGVKVVDFVIGSEDWHSRYDISKFRDFELFGQVANGHIALQDHGSRVWFRNIKIRSL